jgi:low affinity Fe/Cu permease
MSDLFRKFSNGVSNVVGSAYSFILAGLVVIVWAISGPLFGFSDTWQLVINTGTTIITFLMVFLIQNTQNRDTKIMQLKLDELIRAIRGARNNMIDLENLNDKEIEYFKKEFQRLQGELNEAKSDQAQENSQAEATAVKK